MDIQEITIFLQSVLNDLNGLSNITSLNNCIVDLQNKINVLEIHKTETETYLNELNNKIKEINNNSNKIKIEADNYYKIKVKEADEYVNKKRIESLRIITDQKEEISKLNLEMTTKHENTQKEANNQLNYINEEIKNANVNLNYVKKKIKEANDTLANIHKQMDEFKSKTE